MDESGLRCPLLLRGTLRGHGRMKINTDSLLGSGESDTALKNANVLSDNMYNVIVMLGMACF